MKSHNFFCFFSRGEVFEIIDEIPFKLNFVVVRIGNIKSATKNFEKEDCLDEDVCQVGIRVDTGIKSERVLKLYNESARYAGFIIVHMPRESDGVITPGTLVYDDSELEWGMPQAKPLYQFVRKQLLSICEKEPLYWRQTGKRAERFTPEVNRLVREKGWCLHLGDGLYTADMPTPYRFSDGQLAGPS